MKQKKLYELTLSAMFIAIGLLLPFVTGQLKEIGNMLLPMHIPVLLCGFICGPVYGGVVGFILPLLRSFAFGMPAFYPDAVSMAFELCTYGFVSGMISVYVSLITAMIAGRIVWGTVQMIILGIEELPFTFEMFLARAFSKAIPGIILQLVAIPAIIFALERAGFTGKTNSDKINKKE